MVSIRGIAIGCSAAAGLLALSACAPYGLIRGDWQERQPMVAGAEGAAAEGAVPPTAPMVVQLSATLAGANEVPMNFSPGSGAADVFYDQSTHTLSWSVAYGGLSGEPTAAHFHGPAADGENAGVQVNLGANGLASPLEGSAVLTDEQAAQLLGGLWYVNIHSTVNPDGEIRGQVRPM
jgi:hypothetical protein